ncbi:MAG: hypothetical protein ACT4N2_12745 [Hyphomicrobium sp.]
MPQGAGQMRLRTLCGAVLVSASLVFAPAAVEANWLTRLAREAGDAGGKAGKLGIPSFDHAAAYVARLPPTGSGLALAAHVTPEGHWKFASRSGEVYTAATPEELARVASVLEPGAALGTRLTLYLSEDAVFSGREAIKELPGEPNLHLVSRSEAYPLRPREAGGRETLVAEVRPNVVVALGDRRAFDEAVYHLGRSLEPSSLRMLALEPSGPKTLSAVPAYDPATRAPLVDAIDPAALPAALGKLKGQTVLLSGRIDGDTLIVKPASGAETRVAIPVIVRAAEAADVSLVILRATSPRQPGARNWLWQTVAVSGLDDALKRATFGDFLSTLGAGRGVLVVAARPSIGGRVMVSATPSGASAAPMTETVGTWVTDTAGELMGNVIVEGAQSFMPDRERQEELDARIIPGVPSWLQLTYIGSLVAGLLGLEFSRQWWGRLWPPEQRGEYSGALGYQAARSVRMTMFLLIFLPLVGLPALIAALLMQLWRILTAPLRWLRWLRGKAAYSGG